MPRFFLMTEEYDALAGHMQNPVGDEVRLLGELSIENAIKSAADVFNFLKPYKVRGEVFPRRPRLVMELDLQRKVL